MSEKAKDKGQRTKDKLKILQISSARSIGGGEKHLVDLIKGMAGRGHDVYVALRHYSPLRERLEGIVPNENIFAISLRNSFDVLSASQLKRIIREHEIQIVHAHAGRDYPLAALAVRRTKAKLILTRHVLFQLSRLHKITLSNVSRVIAVSKAVENNLLKQRIFPKEKIRVVHNGIEISGCGDLTPLSVQKDEIRSGDLSPQSKEFLVGTVGELKELKGHEEFLRAAALLVKKFDDIQFVVVGRDNSKKRENARKFEKLCDELKIKTRVRFIDWVEPLKDFLSSLDVFVSTSRSESFGLAIVEAMNCGLAVVATKTEGALEIIENEKTGLLVDVGDVEAISNAVELLLNNEAERETIGDAARRIVRERFSLERMIETTEEIYLELLRSGTLLH